MVELWLFFLSCFWGPQKRFKFGILDLKDCLKKLGIGPNLYGKSVPYLMGLGGWYWPYHCMYVPKFCIIIYLTRVQTWFWVYSNLGFQLLKHGHFLINFRFWLFGNRTHWMLYKGMINIKLVDAFSFYMIRKAFTIVFKKIFGLSINITRVPTSRESWNAEV